MGEGSANIQGIVFNKVYFKQTTDFQALAKSHVIDGEVEWNKSSVKREVGIHAPALIFHPIILDVRNRCLFTRLFTKKDICQRDLCSTSDSLGLSLLVVASFNPVGLHWHKDKDTTVSIDPQIADPRIQLLALHPRSLSPTMHHTALLSDALRHHHCMHIAHRRHLPHSIHSSEDKWCARHENRRGDVKMMMEQPCHTKRDRHD
jgi:hypothetical protein